MSPNRTQAKLSDRIRYAASMEGSSGGAPTEISQLPDVLRRVGQGQRARPVSAVVLTGLMRLGDVLLMLALGMGIFFVYIGEHTQSDRVLYFTASALGAIGISAIFQAFQLYTVSALTNVPKQVSRIWLAVTITFSVLVALAFFTKVGQEYSRFWFAAWYVSGLAALLVLRTAMSATVSKWVKTGRLERRAVIVGGGPAGEQLIRDLLETGESDIRVCGVFDDRNDGRVPQSISGYPNLGTLDDLVDFARQTRIDLLLVALPISAEKRLLEIFKKLWVLPVDIRLAAHTSFKRFRPRAYSFLGRVPLIDVSDAPITDWDYLLKSVFDKTIATLAVIGLAPVMAVVALAIKLDSRGPVLFRQKRYGFNNELIEVFKFRSMYTDMSDQNAARLVTRDDPRVTPVGRFIRKTSLDELPQLFNVLGGQLSLVGPRPHALQAKAEDRLYDEVVDGYFARHKVKPGITGWAQINGWRGETDREEKIQKRVEHDLYYIENWSVFFDAYILAKTPISLLKGENAY